MKQVRNKDNLVEFELILEQYFDITITDYRKEGVMKIEICLPDDPDKAIHTILNKEDSEKVRKTDCYINERDSIVDEEEEESE